MRRIDAYIQLTKSGYSGSEAARLITYLQDEYFCPTSRKKASQLERVKNAVRDAGVNPEAIEFHSGQVRWGQP